MNQQAEKVFPKPVDWDELYPNRFLKAGEFKGKKVTLTITEVRIEELEGDKGKQIKGIVSFKETPKRLALNKTNGILLREMFGRVLSDWTGKRVALFPDTWDGDLCIRVWGSPDIEADIEVTVALPRKRPFTKTMKKTGAAVRPVANTAAPQETSETVTESVDVDAAASARLETAYKESSRKLLAEYAKVVAEYADRDADVPMDVEAKFVELRDAGKE